MKILRRRNEKRHSVVVHLFGFNRPAVRQGVAENLAKHSAQWKDVERFWYNHAAVDLIHAAFAFEADDQRETAAVEDHIARLKT